MSWLCMLPPRILILSWNIGLSWSVKFVTITLWVCSTDILELWQKQVLVLYYYVVTCNTSIRMSVEQVLMPWMLISRLWAFIRSSVMPWFYPLCTGFSKWKFPLSCVSYLIYSLAIWSPNCGNISWNDVESYCKLCGN